MSYHELKRKEVRCRKRHQCAWCGEMIFENEMAIYRSYIFNGDFVNSWEHPECYTAMQSLPNSEIAEDGWLPGDYLRGSIEWA